MTSPTPQADDPQSSAPAESLEAPMVGLTGGAPERMMMPVHRWAGADWLRENTPFRGPNAKVISPLGEVVAAILGYVYGGLYHLPASIIAKPDWSSNLHIEVAVADGLATFDFNHLTQFVLLAHACCVRLEVAAGGPRGLKLHFSPRVRTGQMFARHPTIEQAIAQLVNVSFVAASPERSEAGQ